MPCLISFTRFWRELCHWPESPLSSGPVCVLLSSPFLPSPSFWGWLFPQTTGNTPIPHPWAAVFLLLSLLLRSLCSKQQQQQQNTHLPACPAPFSTVGGLISALSGSQIVRKSPPHMPKQPGSAVGSTQLAAGLWLLAQAFERVGSDCVAD